MQPSSDLFAHAGALRALARGILRDADAAEDVVQDTWMRALERPPASRERLGGWLSAVARTLAFRRARGERRRRVREQRAARAESPEADVAERRQALRRLTDAV